MIKMGVTTCFDRSLVGSGVYSPFNRRLIHRPPRILPSKSTVKRPERAIRIGDHINPYTGEITMGQSYIPLSRLEGTNRAIGIFGETGAGKSVTARDIIEYFSIEEGRCVIIFDDTKNQYWSFKQKQDRAPMVNKLRSLGLEPMAIPEVCVYAPAYDEPVLGIENMRRDFYVDKLLSIKTSAITAEAFFELGNIDSSGRMYHNQLKRILNVPAEQRTVDYIKNELALGMVDTTLKRSISSLINIFEPLCSMGIIRDDGTDVKEMLHPPRKGKPGRISVINLATSKANDCRKNAIVSTICQQIFDYVRADRNIKPVIFLDEAKSYIGKKSSEATLSAFSLLHLQGRAWDITRIWGFQNQDDIVDWVFNGNTNYLIEMKKSLPLLDGGRDADGIIRNPTVINDSGLAHIYIKGSGDPSIPDMDMYAKVFPCRSKHVD
jgi:ABC-type dipeptide/oligopeptide/nickel transport system ATPase component